MARFRWLFLLLLFPLLLQAELRLLIDSAPTEEALRRESGELHRWIERHPELASLAARQGFHTTIRREGDRYYLLSAPLPDGAASLALYWRLRHAFPGILALQEGRKSGASVPSPAPASPSLLTGGGGEELSLWLAIFALAIVGVLGLYVSSQQLRRFQERHERILRRHERIERRINELFSRLGEDIYQIGQETVDYTHRLIERVSERELGIGLKHVVSLENRMVSRAGSLLDFLKLKARKVDVHSQPFTIDSLLDDVVGTLLESLPATEKELIFDIDRNVPRTLVGDYLHTGEILGHLLEHAMTHNREEYVRLEISAFDSYLGGTELLFRIHYSPTEEEPDPENFFVPLYDEESGEYRHVGLFVAHELTDLLEGRIRIAREKKGGGGTIDLTLPLERGGDEKRKYHLPSRAYTKKRVMIVDRFYEGSLALQKMFAYFRHRVTVMERERFERQRPSLERYDLLLLDERMVGPVLASHLAEARQERGLKVVLLHNAFAGKEESPHAGVADLRVDKPLNMQRVFGLILELYGEGERAGEEVPEGGREFVESFPKSEGVNLGSFSRFSGATILVVEDNPLNLQILRKILRESGIRLLEAENGAEAIRRMEESGLGEIELVLMDINMPVMDGYQAAMEIRRMPDGGRLPIVALSALDLENERFRMQKAGMDGYLPKPLDIARLYTVFRTYLGEREEGEEIPAEPVRRREPPSAIEWESALESVEGNEALLDELLTGFLDAYEGSDETLRRLFEERRFEEMRKMLIDLMGISRSIGAERFRMVSKELYRRLILHKLQEVPPMLEGYSRALRELSDSLRRYLG